MTQGDQLLAGGLILGVPRSGTTLLRRVLDAHPDMACPGETNIFVGSSKFIRPDHGAWDVDVGLLAGLGFAGFEDEEVIVRVREFAFGFLDEYARRRDKATWVEKTAFNAFYLEDIERICGDSVRYICLIRHGLDVACSIKELCDVNGGYLAEIHDYIRFYQVPMEAFCHIWIDLTSRILDLTERRPEQALLIKYEDLVSTPTPYLSRICKHLDVDDWKEGYLPKALESDDEIGLGDWKTYAKDSIEPTSVGRWKTLSATSIGRLGELVNPVLRRCGYATVEEEVEIDKNHRYKMGLLMQRLKRETRLRGHQD